MSENNYHPKAAFALFLNQAQNNIETVIKDITGWSFYEIDNYKYQGIINLPDKTMLQLKFIEEVEQKKAEKSEQSERDKIKSLSTKETWALIAKSLTDEHIIELETKYFRFLAISKEDEKSELSEKVNIPEKRAMIKELFLKIDDFRNYFSHHYYVKGNTFVIKEDLQNYIKEKYNTAKGNTSDFNKYNPFHKNSQKYDPFIDFPEGNLTFSETNLVVFITSFFLSKHQINLLLQKYLYSKDKKEIYKAVNFFGYYKLKELQSNFITDNAEVKFFLSGIDYLNKIPSVFLQKDLLREKIIPYQITPQIVENFKTDGLELEQTKVVFGENKLYELLPSMLSSEQKRKFGENILKAAKKKFNKRTEKDLFTNFALQFIDTFNLLPDIKFKIYKNTVKKDNDGFIVEKDIKIEYGKIQDFGNEYNYFSKNNNVFFKIDKPIYIITKDIFSKKLKENTKNEEGKYEKKIFLEQNEIENLKDFQNIVFTDLTEFKTKIKDKIANEKIELFVAFTKKEYFSSFSIYELKNIVFALLDNKNVNEEILKYKNDLQNLYKSIVNNEALSTEIKQFKNGNHKFKRTKIVDTAFYLDELPKSIRNKIEPKPKKTIKQQVINKLKQEKARFYDILYKEAYIEVITELKKFIFENKRIQINQIFEKYYENLQTYKQISAKSIKYKLKFNSIDELQKKLSQERNRLQNFEIDIYAEIVNFINRYLPNEFKLGKSANRNVRKLLKGFSNYENKNSYNKEHKLITYLRAIDIKDDESVNILENHKFDLEKIIKDSRSVEDLLKKTVFENINWCKDINVNDSDKLQEAQKIFKIKEHTENYTNTDNIYRLFFNNTAIPRGFIKKKFYSEEKSVNSLIEAEIEDEKLAEYYKYVKAFNEMDEGRRKKEVMNTKGKIISEQKAKDKILLLMLRKMYNDKIAKLDQNLKVVAQIDNLLDKQTKTEIEILAEVFWRGNKTAYGKRTISFNTNEYHKIIPFFNEKRSNSLLLRCFNEGQNEKEIIYSEIIDYDTIHKENMRIDAEQFYMVNVVLKTEYFFEKQLNSDDRVNLVNKTNEKNRIETDDLLKGIQNKKIIKNYRNKAFHNGIPDTGTFEEGINLLDQHIN